MPLIGTYPAALFYEIAFNVAPPSAALPPQWVDVTPRTVFPWSTTRGRQYELDVVPAGQWNTTLDNRDGALDPSNTASAFYPNVVPYRGCRIRAVLGVNNLTVDQATAGGAGGYVGAIPPQMNVSNNFGYPLTIIPFAGAYTGTKVYQTVMPSTATALSVVLLVNPVPVIPNTSYSFQAQVQITTGNSLATNAAILWYDINGNTLTPSVGTAATLTAGAGTWTQLTVSGQAPANAYSAWLKIQPTVNLSAATTYLVDALQWETSATPTPWQMPQTLAANLLPRVIATGSASMAMTDSVANYWWASGPSGQQLAQANYLTGAPSAQSGALAWTTPSGTTSSSVLYFGNWLGQGALVPQADCVQVTAGTTYTGSWYLSRASSADPTLAVTPSITWFNASGASISTASGTPATVPVISSWVRATVSAAAPAGAVWARPSMAITTPSTTTAANTLYLTGAQFEANSAATTWVDPGVTGYIYTGYVERWPQTWTMAGTFGQVNAIGVDAEALLAQDTLRAPFVEEVLALNPTFFYQLNDPAGSTSCVDCSANRAAAPVETSPFGPGSLTFGSSITSTTTAGTFVGSPGPVATFNNNPSAVSPFQYAETFVNLAKATLTPGPSSNTWTRILAFRASIAPTGSNDYSLWTAYPTTFQQAGNSSQFSMGIHSGGLISFGCFSPTGSGLSFLGAANVCDGNWHQAATVFTGSAVTFYLDGVQQATGPVTGGPSGCYTDTLGCTISYGTSQYSQGHAGDMAHAAEIPAALTAAQITGLYNSWRSASAGESSGARAARVLNWLGYVGASAIDPGSTMSMGPATDLTGATGLDALNAIALTENGNVYVSAAGVVTFKSRASRYNQSTPAIVLGERAQFGEWPYESVTADFDPQHLFNDIQVTQYSTSQVAEAVDSTSEGLFYQRILQRTTNQQLFTETRDAASYLLQQYRSARNRISNLTLHPAAVPGMFAACLNLELGTRIRVMRRPPAAPATQIDAFVESINWDLDPTSGEAFCHLQCSPADLGRYWTLAALHTSLASQALSGTSTITINALPDAAVNALGSSIPQNYQLTLDPGTAIAETVTIAPPLPATNIGYSTATLTLTSSLLNTHQAGAVVCEALPAPYTDPTTWDAGSVLAPVSMGAIGSGSTYVNVTPLPDARTNPATADLVPGQLIWIAPGTPHFQGYNLLHPNVSTSGEGLIPLAVGTSGTAVGLTGAAGTPTVTASASAYQGSQVWQTNVAASQATPSGVLFINKVGGAANLPFTASAYMRSATSGANPQVYLYIQYLSAAGVNLGSTNSSTTTLTGSPTAAWTRLTATATAPAGAVWVQVGIVLVGTAPSIAWAWQGDGLQLEQNSSVSAYQTCPQVSSVGGAVAGYTQFVITPFNFTAFGASTGDVVCEPLPPGVTNPSAIAATSRVAY